MFLHSWIYICVGFFFLLQKAKVFQLSLQFFKKGNNLKIGVFGVLYRAMHTVFIAKKWSGEKRSKLTRSFFFLFAGAIVARNSASSVLFGAILESGYETDRFKCDSKAEERLAEAVKLSSAEPSWAALGRADLSWAEPHEASEKAELIRVELSRAELNRTKLQKNLSWAELSLVELSSRKSWA